MGCRRMCICMKTRALIISVTIVRARKGKTPGTDLRRKRHRARNIYTRSMRVARTLPGTARTRGLHLFRDLISIISNLSKPIPVRRERCQTSAAEYYERRSIRHHRRDSQPFLTYGTLYYFLNIWRHPTAYMPCAL
jgi:hypothetical protein